MATEIPVTRAREELADLLNKVAYAHERITLTRHGKPVAALVPADDLAWLEERGQQRISLTSIGGIPDRPQPDRLPGVLPIAAEHRDQDR
jgi:prevent-host-death family protein